MVNFVRFSRLKTVPPGRGAVKIINGAPIAVFNFDGELRAFVAYCPHKYHVLCIRELRDGKIICPGHGERFDKEGRPDGVKTDKSLIKLEVEIRQDQIYVEEPSEELLNLLAKETKST